MNGDGDCGLPSTGCLHREEEEDEAVRRDTSGEPNAAQDGGDSVRHGGGGQGARAPIRVRVGGKSRGGERESRGLGVGLLSTSWRGGGVRPWRAGRPRAARHGGMAPVPVSPRCRRHFCRYPLLLFPFSFLLQTATLPI